MSESDNVIATAARLLLWLRDKPREEISIPTSTIHLIGELEKRGLVAKHDMTANLVEQRIWWITLEGLKWLERHGLGYDSDQNREPQSTPSQPK